MAECGESRSWTNLFLVMQTLVIVLQCRKAFLAAGNVVGGGVYDVAGEELLPEREAAGGTLEGLTSLVWRGGRGGGGEMVCGCGSIEGRGWVFGMGGEGLRRCGMTIGYSPPFIP